MTQSHVALMPLLILILLIPGTASAQDGKPEIDAVQVVSTLDQALLDFIAEKVAGEVPAVVITRTADPARIVKDIRSAAPEERPDILFGLSTVALSQLADQGMLQPREPHWGRNLPVGLSDRDRRWYGIFGDPITIVYNEGYFASEEEVLLDFLPQGWEDLARPRLKGSLIFELPDPYNITGYFTACLIDRAEQIYGDRIRGFDLLSGIDDNTLRFYSDMEQTLKSLFTEGHGSISIAPMNAIEESVRAGMPANFVLPKEGLFLYPRGIALVEGASERADPVYDALTETDFLEACAEAFGCFPLAVKGMYTFSIWPGDTLSMEFFATDHDAVRRNISGWIGEWQNLIHGAREKRSRAMDDVMNTIWTVLVPLIILAIIFTSRKRPRRTTAETAGR